jgi:hypothetical protein
MMKYAIAATAAVLACAPEAASQSILQKSDWKATSLEPFLLPADGGVPWLQLDIRTRLPKGDLPIGRQARSVGHFVFGPVVPETQVSANAPAGSRRM